MRNQSFSTENLAQTLSVRKYKSRSVSKKSTVKNIEEISKSLFRQEYDLTELHSYNIKDKKIYCTKTQDDEIILAKLDENIRKAYRLKQKDRQTIVKQVIRLLEEEVPKYIYKLDLSSFYENINTNEIKEKLINDGIINSESLYVFNMFESALKDQNITGVPRGIGLSASLSELSARPLDEAIKNLDGVYYYTRYVDDILIMSTRRIDIKKEIISIVPKGMTVNPSKTRVIVQKNCLCEITCNCKSNPCRCWNKCKCQTCGCFKKCNTPKLCKPKLISFDFLGYNFRFPELTKNSKNKVSVDISDSKFKKIKNRIYLSVKSYQKKGNFKRLKNRIEFLTGNYYIDSRKSKVSKMKAGVYYSYIHLNCLDKYKELDVFLRKLVYSNKLKKNVLNNTQKEELNKLSFVKGFENKYNFNFAPEQINKIKQGWNNG